MKRLQKYIQDAVTGALIPEDRSTPIILNKEGYSKTCVGYKNVSDDIIVLNNLFLERVPDSGTLYTSLIYPGDSEVIPEDEGSHWKDETFFYVDAQGLCTLYPGDMLKVWIKAEYGTNINVNLSTLNINMTYWLSNVNQQHMISDFQFTDLFGSSSFSDNAMDPDSGSRSVIKGGAEPILRGIGGAFFRNEGDRLTCNFSANTYSSLSVFFKGIIDYREDEQVIFSDGNFEFGIDSARRPYVDINGQRITADKSLYDYNEETVLGVSAVDRDNIIFSINGASVEASWEDDISSAPVDIQWDDNAVIGNSGSLSKQFYGDMNNLIIYSESLPISAHTEIYWRIK